MTDLSALVACPLIEARLSNTSITDLGPLSGVRILIANSTPITSIQPVATHALVELYMNDTAIEDIDPLVACDKLQILVANNTKIESLSPLKGKSLSSIYLANTPIKILDDLARCHYLSFLNISNTLVEDCSPLAACPVDTLVAHHCPITRLGDVAWRLRKLHIDNRSSIVDHQMISLQCQVWEADTPSGIPEESLQDQELDIFYGGKIPERARWVGR